MGAKWSINNQKWAQGPPLPCVVKDAHCVPLHPQTNFACVIIGGWIGGDDHIRIESGLINRSSDVYGLNKELTEWKLLGKIKTGRRNHTAIPLSN